MNHLPAPVTYAEFHERVRCLCALRHASVTSSLRSEQRNAAVGGSPESKHRSKYGSLAADLVLDNQESNIARDALVADAHQLGLWALDEGDHIHVQGQRPGSPIPDAPLG